MKSWCALALGVVLGILSAGVILLSSQPPRGNEITLLPPPTPIPIKVHISGEVQNPSVYALPVNSRVQDAINTAGGFTENADINALNLAAQLIDGNRVQVPPLPQTETQNSKPSSVLRTT
jgi:competence protein ComEA